MFSFYFYHTVLQNAPWENTCPQLPIFVTVSLYRQIMPCDTRALPVVSVFSLSV